MRNARGFGAGFASFMLLSSIQRLITNRLRRSGIRLLMTEAILDYMHSIDGASTDDRAYLNASIADVLRESLCIYARI